MFETPNKITLSGNEYPIKCDMLVLEKVQDKYGDLAKFEDKIRKFVPDVDADGNYIKNADGLVIGHYEYPEISALIDLTYWCICEGMDIEGIEEGRPADRMELMRLVDITPLELSEIMHTEYVGCFARKNPQTTQNQKKAQKKN